MCNYKTKEGTCKRDGNYEHEGKHYCKRHKDLLEKNDATSPKKPVNKSNGSKTTVKTNAKECNNTS